MSNHDWEKTGKRNAGDGVTFHAVAPVFPNHTFPLGLLPDHMGAQACWYYYLLADKAKAEADETDQIVYDGEPWRYRHFIQQKKSVAMIYGLESPDVMDKFWQYVMAEAARCQMPEPSDSYMFASPIRRPSGDQTQFKLN